MKTAIDTMVEGIKQREAWEKNRNLREWTKRIAIVVGSILFFGWLAISIWFAVAGITDNSCTSVSGGAYYCGE